MKTFNSSYAKKAALIVGFTVAVMIACDPALAGGTTFNNNGKSIGQVAGNLTTSLTGIGPLITVLCYVGALVFGFLGALKWKAYGEQPDRTELKIPLTYWGIAVVLAGFPEFLGTGIVSLWGTNAQLIAEPV